MDTAQLLADDLTGHGHHAVTYIASFETLPLLHIAATRTERNDLFGLDTLTLTGYAPGRTEVLTVLEKALAVADGRPVFSAEHGLIDRLTQLSAPVVSSFVDDLMTASAEVTAEYRL